MTAALPDRPTTAVIGAGISGLTAAKMLLDYGVPTTVFELSDRVGGNWAFENPNGLTNLLEMFLILVIPVSLTWTYGRMVGNRLTVAASTIGNIPETQEMLDFCAEHGVVSEIETIRMDEIESAYARMLKGDVKYRFVIDMATL